MGDLNQKSFLEKYAHLAKGPVLEIGSRDYGNTPDYRGYFPGQKYVGVDLSAGKGVDRVVDLAGDIIQVSSELGGINFSNIICFSVLEHCRNVFKMASNMERLLEKGGHLFISVPFSWEYHAFPDDYWRFTPNGIRALFPEVDFPEEDVWISTSNVGQLQPLKDNEFFKIDLAPGVGIQKKRYGFFSGVLIKMMKSLHILDPLLKNIYVLPPVNVNMVGTRR